MSKIKTYNDLLQEEQRLQQVLKNQENLIREDLVSLKENLEPIKKVYDQVHKVFTRDNRVPVFNVGLELGIDMLLRRFILARAGWFAKTFVPYVVKNYASHIIGEEKRKAIIKKIEELFNKIRPKTTKQTEAAPAV
ncbi:MAG TPA: hypothetical protein VL095_05710 [Flavisolibacter sp.]|nr:hypothetical protein [Flavisolibacter sp.]